MGADTFPGFLYQVEATATEPAELHLASSDGCRSDLIANVPDFLDPAIHMTADRSAGVIVWSEETVANSEIVLRRLDFTVDAAGVLSLGAPVTILPLMGEEAAPGDSLGYGPFDIWGDATHSSLYITVKRTRSFNSGPNAGGGSREVLLYDLNDLTGNLAGPAPDERLIFNLTKIPGAANLYGDWLDADPNSLQDCPTIGHPQFVPTCYLPEEMSLNPSGTRLYFKRNIRDRNDVVWSGVQRINIDRTGGPNLADWVITGPELVYTGGGPAGMLARPDSDVSILPSPEYIAVIQGGGSALNAFTSIMDADRCAADFAPYADGMSEAPVDLSQTCLDNSLFFTGTLPGEGDSWQSPEALIKSSFQDPEYDLHRVYVSGALAGTEQLLIETARFGDSGL